jgi:N-acetylmuramoyl-L-alanine amidase
MYPTLAALSPSQAAGLTAYGEARNQPVFGIVAVVCVIRNRVRAGKWATWQAACFADYQFSCWNHTDPNAVRLVDLGERLLAGRPWPAALGDVLVLETCLWIAEQIYRGPVDDVTGGAVSYFNPKVVEAPRWAGPPARKTVTIGDHVFYAGVAL